MESPTNNTNNAELERAISAYKTAQAFYLNFQITREDCYCNALPQYCKALFYIEQTEKQGHPQAAQLKQEYLNQADPKTWGLKIFPPGTDSKIIPDSLKNYIKERELKEQKELLTPLPLNLIEERRLRSMSVNSPSTSGRSSPASQLSSPGSPGSAMEQSSDEELSARISRKFSKIFQLKRQSSLRQTAPAREEEKAPENSKKHMLEKSSKAKDLKALMHQEQKPSLPKLKIPDLNNSSSDIVSMNRCYFHGLELAAMAEKTSEKGKHKKSEVDRHKKYIACANIACAAAQNFLAAYDAGKEEGLEKAKAVIMLVNEIKDWNLTEMPDSIHKVLCLGIWKQIEQRCIKKMPL